MNKRTPKKLTVITRVLPNSKVFGTRLYTISELVGLTKMTRRQVAHWADVGLLKPTLKDSDACAGQPASFYSAIDVVKALLFCDMRRAGFTPSQVKQVAHNLEVNNIHLNKPEAYLITDGYSIYHASSNNEVVDILKHNRQMMLLLPIHEQVEKLKKVA